MSYPYPIASRLHRIRYRDVTLITIVKFASFFL